MATIADRIVTDMAAKGYTLAGRTTGNIPQQLLPNRSNLRRLLDRLHLDPQGDGTQWAVCAGARLRHRTQGYQLLVFVPAS